MFGGMSETKVETMIARAVNKEVRGMISAMDVMPLTAREEELAWGAHWDPQERAALKLQRTIYLVYQQKFKEYKEGIDAKVKEVANEYVRSDNFLIGVAERLNKVQLGGPRKSSK